MDYWSELIGEEGGIDEKCATEYIAPPSGFQGFQDPEQFRRDLYEFFGVDEALLPKRNHVWSDHEPITEVVQ